MIARYNFLGFLSFLLTLFALLLAYSVYLFIIGMFFAALALISAHYARKTIIVKISQVFSTIILVLGTTVIMVATFG